MKLSLKVLITGAEGYIGSYLTNYLVVNPSLEVIALCLKKPAYFDDLAKKCKILECDVTKLDELKNKVPKDIDVVIHLAALNDVKTAKHPEQALIVNGMGTRNVLEIVKDAGIKSFIYFSVLQVYGRELSGTFTVDSPINCDSDYAFTHYVAEGYCKMYSLIHNMNTNVVRLAYSFGCPLSMQVDRWTIIPECFCQDAAQKGEIRLKSSGKSVRDFIPLDYVGRSVEHLISNSKKGFNVYNLSSENVFSVVELANLVKISAKSVLGREIDLIIESDSPTQANKFLAKNNLLGPMKRAEVWKRLSEEIKKTLMMLEANK